MATRPKNPRVLMAETVLAQLRQEAEQQRRQIDDDTPRVPDPSPLDSAQSRRALVVVA